MTIRHVAVIDIGKTNAKLALVDVTDMSEVAVVTRPNTVIEAAPYRHFDIDGHWAFLLNALKTFHADHGVDAISVTTHGACVALLDSDGNLSTPILDYEDTGPDMLKAEYDALRPDFGETGSPRLSMGLNVGAQLHWLFSRDPDLLARTATIVTYPQFWGFKLTGQAATDVTSLGCHTDLWNPHQGAFSGLVDRLGIRDKIAMARKSGDVLGTVLPEVSAATGMPETTQVYCGIHDSNASLLPYVLGQTPPFSVVSTGTWVIAMSVGGDPVTLDPARDTLINVNALGNPVPSARFMGGRAFEVLMKGQVTAPSESDTSAVLDAQSMLLPAVVTDSGPFQGQQAEWINGEPALGSGQRTVAVSYYLANMTAYCLGLTGHRGRVIVEGPFASNPTYLRMLAAIFGGQVYVSESTTGTSQGAALLAYQAEALADTLKLVPADPDPRLKAYAEKWTETVQAMRNTGLTC